MAGYNRPEGGWNYVYDGINVLDAPDAIQPTQYPYARNIRGLADRSVRPRPGYILFSTTPHITTTCPLAPGQVGTAYTATLTATGGVPPYTWSVITGALPTGLSLSSLGVISGTPTTPGLFSFTLLVTDDVGGTDSLACSIYICPSTGTNTDWSGCLAGSFSVPGDWTIFSGGVGLSGGLCNCTGLGAAYKSAGACGNSLRQEVYAIYNTKSTSSGVLIGFNAFGPGVRMAGSSMVTLKGYFFTARMLNGTINDVCGNTGGPIVLSIYKVNAGSTITLANTSISGFDLTPGIPFDIQCVDSGANAVITCFLGGTQVLTATDTVSVLPSGAMGMACVEACGGVPPPSTTFNFIKGQLL